MVSIITITLYAAAWIYILNAVMRQQRFATKTAQAIIAAGLLGHAVVIYSEFNTASGIQLDFYNVAPLFFFVINLLVWLSSLRKPLHNLFIFLMPLSIVSLAIGTAFDAPIDPSPQLTPGIIAHILLSILAYSLLTIASFQALLLAYQNQQLKNKQLGRIVGLMPPLQTMETLLFEMVWVGFAFLTLSIITGVCYIDDIFAQKLSHKTVFSILSWLIYATLLSGHQIFGWRGASAVRWIIGGFVALMIAYFGSKFVIEVLLA